MNVSFTVDPTEAVRYDRDDYELELFWLFAGCVAGKNAKTTATCLNRFLNLIGPPTNGEDGPFSRVRHAYYSDRLGPALIESRLGQYKKLERFMTESAVTKLLDLRHDPVSVLECIHGVGPKTARFFVMFTRPDARYAALDTHILKFLRHNGVNAPKSTPSAGPRYLELEQEFLKLVPPGMTPGEFDLQIWTAYSGNSPHKPTQVKKGILNETL